MPSWLPASALDWTEDDDNDDADLHRRLYLRVKTDEEMKQGLKPSRYSSASGAQGTAASASASASGKHNKTGNSGTSHSAGRFNGTLSISVCAPAAVVTRLRKSTEAAASTSARRCDPGVDDIMVRDRASGSAGGKGHTSGGGNGTVSTRKRSRTAAQMDPGASRDGKSGLNGRHGEFGTLGKQSASGKGSSADSLDSEAGLGVSSSATLGVEDSGAELDQNQHHQQQQQSSSAVHSAKRGRHSHGSSNNRTTTSREQFMKHESKKGWLVCKKCRASVWPPNIGKHDGTCRGE